MSDRPSRLVAEEGIRPEASSSYRTARNPPPSCKAFSLSRTSESVAKQRLLTDASRFSTIRDQISLEYFLWRSCSASIVLTRSSSSFLAEGLAGRLYLFQSPQVLGRAGVPAFPGPFPEGSWGGWRPAFDPERLGDDVLTVYEREG